MKRTYIALIRKEPETEFWVDIPDIPGCVSAGKTVDEARANFAEAIDFHIEGLLQEGAPIPEPRLLNDVLAAEKDSYVDHYEIEINLTVH